MVAGPGILLDVEGTTSSVRFVYDVLFPYARRELAGFLSAHWGEPEVQAACERIAQDAGAPSLAAWCGAADDAAADVDVTPERAQARVRAEVERLMAADAKATGLKELEGLIWRGGYAAGELRSHVYPDVPPALARWAAAGRDVRIYSSGSVAAQKLFFSHTEAGDLTGRLRGHFDTTTGPKREAASYARIAAEMGLAPAAVLFVSDATAELDAARAARMATALARRPGNAPPPAGHGHPEVGEFGEIG